jgi:Ni,Fe-hydrogenase III small subunit
MRDPSRIPVILKEIERIWLEDPDLRLCQLIGNCYESGDIYYKEDDDLLNRLKETYARKSE